MAELERTLNPNFKPASPLVGLIDGNNERTHSNLKKCCSKFENRRQAVVFTNGRSSVTAPSKIFKYGAKLTVGPKLLNV
ncbi:hypothetical protein K1719_008580 [Acacia pycnantha]|nr:hypothetical protein K1719_008580 [Acacia pycnantha]